MKKLLTFLAMVFLVLQTGAQTAEYLQQKDFQAEKKKIYDGINASKRQINEIKKFDVKTVQSIDSLTRIIGSAASQLSAVNDSLAKTTSRVVALQEAFDSQKSISRQLLILLFVVVFILLVIAFIMIFLFQRKANANFQSIADLDQKTNERFDAEIKKLKESILGNVEALNEISTELRHKISTGLLSLEAKNQQLEQNLGEITSGSEEKIKTILLSIAKLQDDHSVAVKNLDARLNTLKQDFDAANQAFANRAGKVEEELHLLKGKR